MKVTNVEVATRWKHCEYALSWHFKGDRYHVWLNRENLKVMTGIGKPIPTVYKNSMAKRGQPGHFDCRQLDATKPANRAMIDVAMQEAVAAHLFEKCEQEVIEREEKRLAKAAAEYKVTLAKEAGPELLAAARGILYGIEELLRGFRITHVVRGQCKGQKPLTADDMSAASEADDQFQKARQVLEAAIRKAEGQ